MLSYNPTCFFFYIFEPCNDSNVLRYIIFKLYYENWEIDHILYSYFNDLCDFIWGSKWFHIIFFFLLNLYLSRIFIEFWLWNQWSPPLNFFLHFLFSKVFFFFCFLLQNFLFNYIVMIKLMTLVSCELITCRENILRSIWIYIRIVFHTLKRF